MVQSEDDAKVQRALAAIGAASSAASVRAFIENAKMQLAQMRISQSHAVAIQRASLRRLAELAGQHADDLLARRWIEGIAAFEAITGKRASRTRPMLERHGAQRAFEKLVDRTNGTAGFEQMIEAELHDMTAEWIVLEFRDLFDDRIRDIAEQRLTAAGVEARP